MNSSSTSLLEQAYSAEVLREIPTRGRRFYFADSATTTPLLVRFTLADGTSWHGGFGAGTLATRALTGVFATSSATRACVASSGRAYFVEVEHPEMTEVIIPELVTQVWLDAESGVLLIADPWRIRAYSEVGESWSGDRIAVEGLSILSTDGCVAVVRLDEDGEGREVKVSLRTGALV